MNSKQSFLANRIKSVGYAFKGAVFLLKTEPSIKVQFFIGIIVTAAGFYYKITPTEWLVQFLAIGLVVSIEGVNTAIEELANFIHPEHHKKIGIIKDIAAGAVFLASVFAIAVGFIIYIPKFF
jgi:diacylglycerol kinase (ATP)